MDRRSTSGCCVTRRVPHARGDGPSVGSVTFAVYSCSPRAWGWTGSSDDGHGGADRVPHARGDGPIGALMSCAQRRVPHARGDGPRRTRSARARGSVPHARGDGPILPVVDAIDVMCSPRAWGWTESEEANTSWVRLFPTRVGMDRWGRSRRAVQPAVFPTRVGMDRGRRPSARRRWRRPHARGDGPETGTDACRRAWMRPLRRRVPTRVGMDRRLGAEVRGRAGVPHARGDGPPGSGIPWPSPACSPRAWGWTVHHGEQRTAGSCSPRAWGWTGTDTTVRAGCGVFPTQGMDRTRDDPASGRPGVSHARGDGPQSRPWRLASHRCSLKDPLASPRIVPPSSGSHDSHGLPKSYAIAKCAHLP